MLDASGAPLETALGQAKPFALLAYLALAPDRFVSRGILRALLWPESDETRASNSLRVSLSRLRSALGRDAIRTRPDHAIALNSAAVDSDVVRLRRALEAGDWRGALDVYGGPLLPGFHVDGCSEYMAWLDGARAELEHATLSTVLQQGEAMLDAGDAHGAAEAGAGALRVQGLEEEALRLRLRALAASGRRGQALKEAGAFVEAFRQALDMPPSEATVELIGQLREGPAEHFPDTGHGEEKTVEASAPAPTPVDSGRAVAGAARVEQAPHSHRRLRWTLGVGGLAVGVCGVVFLLGSGHAVHRPDPTVAAMVAKGRHLFQQGDYKAAEARFRKATEADSLDGEAFYRLAVTADWLAWPDIAKPALQRAEELAPSAPLRIQRLVWALAHPGEARKIYQAILAKDPEDPDALLLLGDLEFHWGPTLGIPPAEARPEFERLLRLVPGHQAALVHLLRLAGMRGDLKAVRELHGTLSAEHPSAVDAAMGTVLEAVLDPGAPFPKGAVKGLDDGDVIEVMEVLASVTVEPDRVDAFLADLTRAVHTKSDKLEPYLWDAAAAMARGRPTDADAWLDSVGTIDPARRDEFKACFTLLPFLHPGPAARAAADSLLRAHAGDPLIGPTGFDLNADAIYAHRRLFLEYLTQVPRPGENLAFPAFDSLKQQTWMDQAFVSSYRRYLRARAIYRVTTEPKPALEALSGPGLPADSVLPSLVSYPLAYERLLRADLLRKMGRSTDALRWYETFPDTYPYDRAFLPYALVRRGWLQLEEGDHSAAITTLRLAVEYLANAEPPFASLLTEARNGLGLASGTGASF